MSNENQNAIFPLVSTDTVPVTLDEIIGALNNLNDRVVAVETRPASTNDFSAADRTLLNEVGDFFGVHRVVANTVASRAAGAKDIDPATGLPRVVQPLSGQAQTFVQQEVQPGA